MFYIYSYFAIGSLFGFVVLVASIWALTIDNIKVPKVDFILMPIMATIMWPFVTYLLLKGR